ncbi:MAG: hypothetical protein ACI8RD_012600 [Bacillariaceae sp.]|jgi:hypothetical protein
MIIIEKDGWTDEEDKKQNWDSAVIALLCLPPLIE